VLLRLLALTFIVGLTSPTAWAAGHLEVLVTVDWEGRNISQENLEAIAAFRQAHPSIPLLHYLNAAYFTKPGADGPEVRKAIQSALRPGDEAGLHIHGWKSLFKAAGVSFRSSPQFNTLAPVTGCATDCGHMVPISAYTVDELRRVIRFSATTLKANGFGYPRSFRAGGWMASPAVLEALAAEGFKSDSSAVPTYLLADSWGDLPLFQWLKELWPATDPTTQPYAVPTPAGSIREIPDNGCLADYMPPEKLVDTFERAAQAWLGQPESTRLFVVGFHQETASAFLEDLAEGLARVSKRAKELGVPLRVKKLPL
jgi:hypothetical protein